MDNNSTNSVIEKTVLDLAILFGVGLFVMGLTDFINEFEDKYYLQDVTNNLFSYKSTQLIIVITGIFTISASLITYFTKEVEIENNTLFLQKVIKNWLFAALVMIAPIFIFGKTINRKSGNIPRIEKFYILSNNDGVARIIGDIDNKQQMIKLVDTLDPSLKEGDSIQLTSRKGLLGYTHSVKYKGKLIINKANW